MPNLTPNYSFYLPLVGDATDSDLWGGYLNDNFTSLDSLVDTATNWVKRVVTATDTATTSDRNKILLGNATVASYVQTLPSAATAGDGFTVVVAKTDATTNTITIDGDASDTVLGAANFVLNSQNQGIALISDGVSNWNAIGYDLVPQSSDTVSGKIEIATSAEVATATSTTLAVTPGRMIDHWGVAKGIVKFNGSGSIIAKKGDIASVVKNSTGTYTVTTTGVYTQIYPMVSMSPNDATRFNAATINAYMASTTRATIEAQKYSTGAYDPTEITVFIYAVA